MPFVPPVITLPPAWLAPPLAIVPPLALLPPTANVPPMLGVPPASVPPLNTDAPPTLLVTPPLPGVPPLPTAPPPPTTDVVLATVLLPTVAPPLCDAVAPIPPTGLPDRSVRHAPLPPLLDASVSVAWRLAVVIDPLGSRDAPPVAWFEVDCPAPPRCVS